MSERKQALVELRDKVKSGFEPCWLLSMCGNDVMISFDDRP